MEGTEADELTAPRRERKVLADELNDVRRFQDASLGVFA